MTTNQRTACLNAESMEWLAQGEFPAAELAQLEEHIGSCEHCRCMLESASIDSQWNDEVLPVLRTPSDGNGMFGDPKDVAQDEQSLESVLKLLGPTDDPHKLGRIGSYEVIGVIGRGGMGVVFKALDAALNRFVAIKMLLPHLAISGAARKRFAREGQAAAAVIDDNVLPIYSVAEWQGVPYLVTQYSRGMTLQKRIQNQGPLELKEILRIGMQTARGLAAAHAQGLVHRDVKPSNILLDGTVERALLTDFGLARAVDDASITRTGIIAGTPQYMSPEQARGGSVDARSDLFGLGCVLYTMCTGRPPFRADNSYAVLRLITDAEPRPIREINPEIPEWLCRVIARLMAKLPNERFASATEVADLLESCLAHVQQPTVTSLPEQLLITQSVNERKNIGRWMAVIGAVLIGLLGVFGFVISLQSQNGTLLIESTVDDVTVRVSQGDTVVRKLTVTKAGTKIDVAAGSYTVAIEGNVDGIAIENDKVNLRRGGTEIVTLTYQRPDETRTSQVGSTTADPASSEQQLKLLEQAIFVTDVRSNGQVLYFTLNQWKFPEGALGLLEIQFRCEKPMPLVWTGPAPDAATVLSPKHTVEWLGMAALPVIPLPIGPAGHKVAFIFPDDDSAVVAAKQLAAIGDQSLLDAQRRSNSIDGRLRDDGIIFGEHAAIGRYTTEFRLLYRMDPAPSVNLQLPRIEAATWQRMYVSALTNPIFAKRYQLTEAQQQQVLKLQTELNQRPTPINRHELMIETQTAIQKVLTLEQDQQVWRDIFVAWNINKFRDANILDQLQATDAQRSQIDAIWQAMSQKTENAPVGEVDTAAERQRVFDEILGLLTREQQQKWQQELLETPFDSQQPHPVEMMPAPFDGAISNAIGNYRTHFPVPVRNEVTPEQPGHGIQRPQFVGVNWRPLYLAVVTHPTAATRYSLTEPQQQEIKTLFDEFVRTSTVEAHDDLLKLTQTTVQEVLTPVQDENVRREIWIRWNVTKFRDPKILFQLNITDEQQQQIDAIWQASQERIGPFQDPPAIPGLSTAFTPARLAVEGPTESQRVFDEIYAILTIRQRSKFLSEIQDPIVDGLLPDTRQRVLAIPKGAVREIAAPPQAQMALAFPTINWRQVYMGKAMETRFARRQHLTAKQQQRMHDIIQVFLRNATPATRNMGERRAQSAIQNLLTIDQDRLLRREIWVAMNATRLRVPTTHEQLGLNSEQRRQIDGIWSKFETEVQQNGGQRADGSDSYERIFDEIFDVLTSEQRRLYLFKFQDPVFHSGTQPIPFGVDWNPDDFPAQEKDPPRLVDVLDLHLRRERERFPLLEQVVDDIHLLEGGGLEILERPVLADREQYAKDHPELAKAFEAWQNDYRDVLRVSEIIPELFQEDTRPVMVTVARLLIQSEDIPGISKEQLAHANQELGEYPTDKLVERVFLELGEAGHGNLRRKLRESGANLPHTGTHENHLRIAEKEKTYLIFARLYCGIEQSEMFRQNRKLRESVDPATEFLFEESHAIPNDKALSFLSRRGHEEVRHRERTYHALPKDSVTVNWRVGEEGFLLKNPGTTVITHVIIDRRMDGHALWKCYGIPQTEKVIIPAAWFRRDPFPQLGNHGATRNSLYRMEMELASHEPAQRELALTTEQMQQIAAVNVAGISFDPNGGLTQQSSDAHDRIIQILLPEQRARLEQLLVQRLGLYAFEMGSTREALEISAEQQRQIQESWKEHAKRVQDYDVMLNDQHIAVQTGKIDASQLKASIADHQHQKFASAMRVWNEVYLILDAAQRQKFETLRGAQVTTAEIDPGDTGAADLNMQNPLLEGARVQVANRQLKDPNAVLLSELQGIWVRTAVVDIDGQVVAYDKPVESDEVIFFKDSTVIFHQQGNDDEAPLKFTLDASTPTPFIDVECPDGQFSLGLVEVRNGTLHLQLGGCGDDRPSETLKPKLHAQYRRMPSSLEALCHQSEQGTKNLEDVQKDDAVVREANRQLKDPNAVMTAALQGSWILTGMTTGQQFGAVSNPLGTGHRIEFDMSRVILHQGPGAEAAAGTFVLDTSLNPVEIDIKSERGLYTLGFIELNNGTLDLQLGAAGGDRPGKSDKPEIHYQYRRKPEELRP